MILAEVDVGYKKKREVEDDTRIFGLSNWKNEVNSILSQLTGMGKSRRTAGLERSSEA